jgi:hypothetical protein
VELWDCDPISQDKAKTIEEKILCDLLNLTVLVYDKGAGYGRLYFESVIVTLSAQLLSAQLLVGYFKDRR